MVFHDVFLLVFFIPCSASIVLTYLAAATDRINKQVLCLSAAVLSFWVGMAVASDLAYRALQASPNPPADAFNDSSPAGIAMFGWIPAGIFCLIVYSMCRIARSIYKRFIGV